VFFVLRGRVKLSVLSPAGKQAVIALISKNNFIGEQAVGPKGVRRTCSAVATTACSLLRISRAEISRVIREEHAFSDRFITHLLSRAARAEDDLTDLLFNSTEKRLARALLLMANFGDAGAPRTTIPNVSQDELAQIVGSTRSRVNFLLNRFRRLGYIQYNGVFHVYRTLLTVVLRDSA
jgi:CRP-like cAMP-binding protein